MNEERCKRLEERQAALEQRVGAAIDVAIATLRDEIGVEDALDRLAALRSPEVVIPSEPVDVAEMQAQIHEADMDRIAASERLNAANAALATARRERDAYRKAKEENDERFMTERDDARRERDEAVAIVRDWLVWRSVHHVSDVHFPDLASVLSRARALVAGQATPDARDAEIAGWREASKAMTGEIATLRAQLDTALARVAELEAREVAANHRALGLQYELDTVVAALQERDRESRWIIEHIPMMQGSPTFEARVAEYLSATPPADPARGLIERLVAAYDGCSRRGTIEECNAQERAVYDAIRDLRAQLDTALARVAELEARDREGRWLVERSNHRQVGKVASDKQRAEMDDYSRRADTYLSGTPPADPARGLIERAVAAMIVLAPQSPLIADLRAYLGGE